MGPKAAPKAKAAAEPKAAVVPPPPQWDPNTDWYVEAQHALEKIKHAYGPDICSRPALPLSRPHDSPNAILGFQEPFNEAALHEKASLGRCTSAG